jgi:hypothetical protein
MENIEYMYEIENYRIQIENYTIQRKIIENRDIEYKWEIMPYKWKI